MPDLPRPSLVEAVIEPDLPIVDPHHHLWDRGTAYDAVPADAHPFTRTMALRPHYLLPEFLEDLNSGHNIRATVFIDCRAFWRADGPEALKPIGETEFVNGVAAMGASGTYGDVRPCAGIVSHADMALGDAVAPVLEAHVAAGNGRFRGIRHSASWDADPDVLGILHGRVPQGFYREAAFREAFRHLGRLGLTFDAWLLEPQLPDLIDLWVERGAGRPRGPGGRGPKQVRRRPGCGDRRAVGRSCSRFVRLCGRAPAGRSRRLRRWRPGR